MTYSALPHGSAIFIDANIFVYCMADHPKYGASCKQLMDRIARKEIIGFTSAHVLGDVAHRLMTIEAMDQFGWPAQGIGNRLRQNPAEVQKLTRFVQAVTDVPQFGVQILSVHSHFISSASVLCQKHGMLLGDGLIVAMMNHHGLTNLASADTDFDRIPGLTRHGPV